MLHSDVCTIDVGDQAAVLGLLGVFLHVFITVLLASTVGAAAGEVGGFVFVRLSRMIDRIL